MEVHFPAVCSDWPEASRSAQRPEHDSDRALDRPAQRERGCVESVATHMRIEAHWPVQTVLPLASALFYLGYFVLWDPLLRRFGPRAEYERLAPVGRMCFRANCNSIVHTYVVVVLLCWMLATDATLLTTRLEQHYNPIGYAAMCVTLGYFSLSVPWNAYQRFVKKEYHVVPLGIFAHHLLVVAGALLYVVTNLAAFYGVVAFVCMECSNWFFIPRALVEQLGRSNDGPLGTINGACLVLSFLLLRIGVCTVAAVLFLVDLGRFDGGGAEWACVLLAFAIFAAVLGLSYVWLKLQVLPGLWDAVGQLLKQRRLAQAQRRIALTATALSQQGDAPSASYAPNQAEVDYHLAKNRAADEGVEGPPKPMPHGVEHYEPNQALQPPPPQMHVPAAAPSHQGRSSTRSLPPIRPSARVHPDQGGAAA